MPPASAGNGTNEADQNRIAPVPGNPERLGADGVGQSEDAVAVFVLALLAGLFTSIGGNLGPKRALRFTDSHD
jgi:hypothetical protein